MHKRFIISFLCVVLIIFLTTFCFYNTSVIDKFTSADIKNTQQIIIIDAGHGGFDGGAVASDGTIEKDLNLSISLKLDQILRLLGFDTIMVRTTDTAVNNENDDLSAKVSDIKYRAGLMQEYPKSIYISIHMNKYSTTQPHGAQVFYANTLGSDKLAAAIQQSIADNVQSDNKRVIKPTNKNIYILSHATVPAVITECGFLSNPNDLSNLKNSDYQLKLAMAVSFGILNYNSVK